MRNEIAELTYMYRFMIAVTSCEKRLRKRIEAAIADAIYKTPGIIGDFPDKNVRYQARRIDELPLNCKIESSQPLLGLPDKLVV